MGRCGQAMEFYAGGGVVGRALLNKVWRIRPEDKIN
jgi:hypothetical protein